MPQYTATVYPAVSMTTEADLLHTCPKQRNTAAASYVAATFAQDLRGAGWRQLATPAALAPESNHAPVKASDCAPNVEDSAARLHVFTKCDSRHQK